MTQNISLLVFDWDGTLMDSASRIVDCLQSTIKELQLDSLPAEELRDIIGLGLPEAATKLYPDADVSVINAFIETYRKYFLMDTEQPTPLFPGARTALEELNGRGYLMAVATGKSRRGLDRSLDESGCRNLFHATRCADETFSKPHPQMLIEIMDILNVAPEMTLMIGDTEYDMVMAEQAGAAALAVDYGVHSRERLMALGPLDCLGDIRELCTWLPPQQQN